MSDTAANDPLQERLRNLYFTRTVVQLLWAFVVIAQAASNPPLAAGLLILYPLWDVACTIYDLRASTRSISGPPTAQFVNAAFGILAAIGIAATVFKSPQQAVITFGVWAAAAGLAQFAVGLTRRKALGGQWAMILSGVQSTAGGVFFILGALHDKVHIADLGRYAIVGGVYFLVAGYLLHRKLARSPKVGAAAAI
jgi:uncharacterized membrane protein HdeD (DUF308 family)